MKVCMVRLCIRYFRMILAVVSCVLNESSNTSGTSATIHSSDVMEAQVLGIAQVPGLLSPAVTYINQEAIACH